MTLPCHFVTGQPMDLIGVTEIAQLAGVSRKRAYELVAKTDFPTPAAQISRGKLWHRSDIEAWIAEWEERKRSHGWKRPERSA